MSIHPEVMLRCRFECLFSMTLLLGDPDFVSLKLRFVPGRSFHSSTY
jgi:hypothetical protein